MTQQGLDTQTAANGMVARWLSALKSLRTGFLGASQSLVSFFQCFYHFISTSLPSARSSSDVAATVIAPWFTGSRKPTFFSGDFSQAVEAALEQNRVLIVYIHHDRSEHAGCIISTVLTNGVFLDLVTESSVIIWATLASRYDAAVLARRFFHCREYPYLAITQPSARHSMGGTVARSLVAETGPWDHLELLGSLEGGSPDLNRALELLVLAIERVSAQTSCPQAWQERLEEDRRLRREQQRAYEEAVQKDKQLEAQRKAAEKQALEREQQNQREKRVELEKLQKAEEEKQTTLAARWKSSSMFLRSELERAVATALCGSANDQSTSKDKRPGLPGASTSPSLVLIKVKLPSGVTIERRFAASTPLASLFSWVDAFPMLWSGQPNAIETTLQSLVDQNPLPFHAPLLALQESMFSADTITAVCGFSYNPTQPVVLPYSYDLSTPHPMTKFERPLDLSDKTTLEELGLTSSTILFLHEKTSGPFPGRDAKGVPLPTTPYPEVPADAVYSSSDSDNE